MSRKVKEVYCPECGYEYRTGFDECPECQVPLVVDLGGEVDDSGREAQDTVDIELVTILDTGNPGLVAVVKSVLDGSDILYIVEGEVQIGLFGVGLSNKSPVRIKVRQEDEAAARELLSAVEEEPSSDPLE